MPAKIPASHLDLIERPVFVVLSTVMRNGQPQSTPVWCDFDGTDLLVNTMAQFQKAKNMKADPRVTVLAYELDRPLRYLEIRGRVVEISEDGAHAHLDKLTLEYTGMPSFFGGAVSAEMRDRLTPTIFRIEPWRARAEG